MRKYEALVAEIRAKGWTVVFYAIPLGCRGGIPANLTTLLRDMKLYANSNARVAEATCKKLADNAIKWLDSLICTRRHRERSVLHEERAPPPTSNPDSHDHRVTCANKGKSNNHDNRDTRSRLPQHTARPPG